MYPPRKPVATGAAAASPDSAEVSPPDITYHMLPAGSTSMAHSYQQPSLPQRMGTVVSSEGKFTVSPASSIREGRDEEDDGDNGYGYHGRGAGGGAAGKEMGFTPSPIRYRSTAQVLGGWLGGGGGGGGGESGRGRRWGSNTTTTTNTTNAAAAAPVGNPAPTTTPTLPNLIQPQPLAPGLWQTQPDPSDIPFPAPPQWRGSRDMQELTEARARSVQGRPNAAPVLPAVAKPAPAVTTTTRAVPVTGIGTGYEITPVLTMPWETRDAERERTLALVGRRDRNRDRDAQRPREGERQEGGQVHRQGQVQSGGGGVRSDSAGPFMHYEDIDYFGPVADSEPKDESRVDGALPRADTFPDIPENMNQPRARRSWDRQRRRRRKNGRGGGGGGPGGKREGGGGFGAFGRYCMHWLPELLCCLLGIICFAIIIGVLKKYDGRGLTDWPLTVSLNTVIAFLVAICQLALSVPLTEGLSQLKWNSFARGEKPLADYQTFEDAKRWPVVGSALMLGKRKGRALGMSAATALLTSFLLSPLTQGAITYPTRSFEAGSGTASAARSESYSHPVPYGKQPTPAHTNQPNRIAKQPTTLLETLDTREKQAIQSGIYHAVDEEVPQPAPICSSGDCQWRNFSSLAVCAAVADVSDRLAVSDPTRPLRAGVSLGAANNETVRRAALPNGLFLVGSTTTCNLNVSWPHVSTRTSEDDETDDNSQEEESFLPARTSLAFSDQDGRVSSAIANFFVVYTNQTAEVTQEQAPDAFRAVEVLLHFCVNTYEVSTSGGVAASKVVYSSALAAQDGGTGNTLINVRGVSSSSPGVRLYSRSDGDQGVYSVKRDDVRLLNRYVLSLFSGTYSHQYRAGIGGETATSEALGTAMFGRQLDSEEDVQVAVRNLTTNVAASLTKTIRARSTTSETGTVLTTESYVGIRWAWLSFLAIQVAISFSFLMGIMVQTAVWNVKILKGSSTAALLAISADDKAYLEERELILLNGPHSNEQEAQTARTLRAMTCRFMSGDRGWTLGLGKREDG